MLIGVANFIDESIFMDSFPLVEYCYKRRRENDLQIDLLTCNMWFGQQFLAIVFSKWRTNQQIFDFISS